VSLIFGAYYLGLPKDQIATLETVAQATVSRLYDLSTRLLGILTENPRAFGDMDFSIEKRPNNVLLYKDHSAGWWAVIQVTRLYKEGVSFRVFANRGDVPDTVLAGTFRNDDYDDNGEDWKHLDTEFMYGRADMYFHARKNGSKDDWYCPLHLLNYQHPLLFNLQNAVDEIDKKA
jgi:hypothetical protein